MGRTKRSLRTSSSNGQPAIAKHHCCTCCCVHGALPGVGCKPGLITLLLLLLLLIWFYPYCTPTCWAACVLRLALPCSGGSPSSPLPARRVLTARCNTTGSSVRGRRSRWVAGPIEQGRPGGHLSPVCSNPGLLHAACCYKQQPQAVNDAVLLQTSSGTCSRFLA